MAGTRGMAVLAARGIELERDASFGVAAGLFAAMLAAAPDRERARLLSGQASLAATLFDPAAPEAVDSSALVRGLYWLTVNAAADSAGDETPSGLLIVVDDIQWADRPSLSFLAYLAARIDELPAVLVVTVRSGERAEDQQTLHWLRERPAHGVLAPRTLSSQAIAQLVRAELPASEPGFIQACTEVSGGNPFLARQLLWALRTEEIPPTAGSAARVRSLVPDAVMRSVLVRLNRRGDAAGRLAQAVAVLGDRVPLRHARLLAGLDAEPAEEAADALADAGILTAGEPLRFTHPLIGSSVYADIPAFARARAHRRAEDLLTADGAPLDAVAAHVLLTRPDGDQRTVAILREAAAQALNRGDPGAAARLLARALAEPPAPAARGHVLLELANAELEQGDMSAGDHIEEALPMFEAPEDRVPALAALARLHFNRGAHEAAAGTMEEALELLKPEDPALPPLLVSYLTASTFRAELAPLAAKRLQPLIEAARDGRPPDDPGLLAHLVLRLAFAAEPAERIRMLAARATAADPLVEPASLGILTGLIVQALCCVDELDDAERICAAAIAAARRRGSLLNFTMTSYHRAIGRYHRGELSSALADLDQALLASQEGWTAGDSWTSSLCVHIHVERGDLAAARKALPRPPTRCQARWTFPSPASRTPCWHWPRGGPRRPWPTRRPPGSCSPPASASITQGSCPGGTRPPWPRTPSATIAGPAGWPANSSPGPAGPAPPVRLASRSAPRRRSTMGNARSPRLPKRPRCSRAAPRPCSAPMCSSNSVRPAVARASGRPPRRRCVKGCSWPTGWAPPSCSQRPGTNFGRSDCGRAGRRSAAQALLPRPSAGSPSWRPRA